MGIFHELILLTDKMFSTRRKLTQIRSNIDFFPFFLSSFSLNVKPFNDCQACQWIRFHACQLMENGWTNHSHAVVTWQKNWVFLEPMIGKTCRLTQLPIQSMTSAWVRKAKKSNFRWCSKDSFSLEIAVVSYEPDDDVKHKKLLTLNNEVIPFYLEKLEDIARENGGYLAAGKVRNL